MSSVDAYTVLVALVVAERLAELIVAKHNAAVMFARGAVEVARGHYPFMAVMHALLLVACLVEVRVLDRPFVPALGLVALAAVVGSQVLRWWCVLTLGRQWNTRIIVAPGMPLVTRGPYRWLKHPNYVAVVVEVAALPLVHSAVMTAAVFSLLNAVLLVRVRIPAENRALSALAS